MKSVNAALLLSAFKFQWYHKYGTFGWSICCRFWLWTLQNPGIFLCFLSLGTRLLQSHFRYYLCFLFPWYCSFMSVGSQWKTSCRLTRYRQQILADCLSAVAFLTVHYLFLLLALGKRSDFTLSELPTKISGKKIRKLFQMLRHASSI